MVVSLANAQREAPVPMARMHRLARAAVRALRIRAPGRLEISFITVRRLRAYNRRFLRHDRITDVLSFRYPGEPTVGEILIAPARARVYARAHGLTYQRELARYVVHGLLHWMGHEDRTRREQTAMRAREDRLLARCGIC